CFGKHDARLGPSPACVLHICAAVGTARASIRARWADLHYAEEDGVRSATALLRHAEVTKTCRQLYLWIIGLAIGPGSGFSAGEIANVTQVLNPEGRFWASNSA